MGRRKKENLNVKPARQEYEDKLKPMRRLTKGWKTIKAILYEDWTFEKWNNYHWNRSYIQGKWDIQIYTMTYSEKYTDEWTYIVRIAEEWDTLLGNTIEFETNKKTEMYPMFWFEDRKIG